MRRLIARLLPLALLALAGAGIAGWTAWRTGRRPATPPPADAPPTPRFAQRICAMGVVEPLDESVAVAPSVPGLVAAVLVAEGDHVTAGQPLLRMDVRAAEARRDALEVDVAAAAARLDRLAALPRAEDAEPAERRVAVADARLAHARARRERAERLDDDALGADEREARVAAEAIAAAELAAARADLAHARLPAWPPDLAAARAEVAAARARIAEIDAEIARGVVAAPRDGVVLLLAVRVGEHLSLPAASPAIVIGDPSRLAVRLEVDESQAARLREASAAEGWLRGDDHRLTLAFVRIVPQARPKAALPGAPDDRIDARAIQVIYRLVEPTAAARPGLLMEAEIQTDRPAATP